MTSPETHSLLVEAVDVALRELLPKTRYEVRWMTDALPDAVVKIQREQFSAIAPCNEFTSLVWALMEAGYGR